MPSASATRAFGLNPNFWPRSSIAQSPPRERSGTRSFGACGRTCDGSFDRFWQWADKPPESSETIPAELHRAVMEFAAEDRRERAAVSPQRVLGREPTVHRADGPLLESVIPQ
jgi:hypothetical protein